MRVITVAQEIVKNALAYIRKESNSYYKFGTDDRLPNEIVAIVNNSGTARACVEALSKFTQGLGFVDAALGTSLANKNQTFNGVLGDLSLNVSYLRAITFRVLYDNSGNPARIYAIPAQTLRRLGENSFVYNPLLGYPHRMTPQDKYLQAFNPAEPVQDRIKRISAQISKYGEQFGDIVYHFRKGIGLYQDVYSVPGYYSGIEDVESDAGISKLERRNIQKGWKTPIIISTGPMNHEVKDENGLTQFDKFEAGVKKFGSEEAPVALHLEGATNETKPEVKTISIADIMDQTDKATDRVGRKVCRHFGVPPVLVGFATPGQLGNTQELKNTMDLFRLVVVEPQDLIKEALRSVFPQKNFDVLPLILWNETAKV